MSMRLLFVALLLLASTAMASEFRRFEGKDVVYEGDGGVKTVVGGVEFWEEGEPPRPYRVVGYITDRRRSSGLIGKMQMSGRDKDIAKIAKKYGGDAVMMLSSATRTTGAVSHQQSFSNAYGNSASGNSFSSAVTKDESKYVVLKYLSQEEIAALSEAQPAQ